MFKACHSMYLHTDDHPQCITVSTIRVSCKVEVFFTLA